jgi:choline dehydrogenase-like flavoprotein
MIGIHANLMRSARSTAQIRNNDHISQSVPRQQVNSTTSSEITWLEDYEYVVVGSGAGGSPLAARLAIAGYKVLLIEAGDDQGDALQQQIPALFQQSEEYTPMKWDYFVQHYDNLTEQEQDSKMTYENADGTLHVGANPPAGATPLGIYYPRAGTLGGCTAHNAMISIYPHESDWTNIATITGDDTWAPANMRTYFERLERNRYLPSSVVGHGYNGWYETSLTDLRLVVEDLKLLSLVIAAATAIGKTILTGLLSTVLGLGEVLTLDINSGLPGRDSITGLFQVPIAVLNDEKKRNGPQDFLMSTINAVNSDGSRKYQLDIRTNALVTKVRFSQNGTTPRAVGVDFMDGQSLYRADPRWVNATVQGLGAVNATREVILSAGTFNTPQLLKLSGIGAADELAKFDIPVMVDLPGVGTNMQDRYEQSLIGESNINFTVTEQCTFLNTTNDPCLEQWQNDPLFRGVYGTNGIALAVIIKSSAAAEDDDPDILVSAGPANFPGYYPNFANIGLSDSRHWSWIVLKAHSCNNAGTVTLKSADPRDMPQINFRSFDIGGDLDVQAVYEGLQFSRESPYTISLAKSKTIKPIPLDFY